MLAYVFLYQGWIICFTVAWSIIAIHKQLRRIPKFLQIAYPFAVSAFIHYYVWRLTDSSVYPYSPGRIISDTCYDAVGALGIVLVIALLRNNRIP